MAQLVGHLIWVQDAGSSNLPTRTKNRLIWSKISRFLFVLKAWWRNSFWGQFPTHIFKGSEKIIPAALFFVYCAAFFDCCTNNPVSKELWYFSMLFLAIFIASTDSSASLSILFPDIPTLSVQHFGFYALLFCWNTSHRSRWI